MKSLTGDAKNLDLTRLTWAEAVKSRDCLPDDDPDDVVRAIIDGHPLKHSVAVRRNGKWEVIVSVDTSLPSYYVHVGGVYLGPYETKEKAKHARRKKDPKADIFVVRHTFEKVNT